MNTTLTKIMQRIKEQSPQVRLLAVGCVVLGIAGAASGDWTLGIVSVVAGVLALIWK
jgi:4-hydroxybenzoate polyprenyltransferase